MFVLLLLFFVISSTPSLGVDEFKVIQKINYSVDSQGFASVAQEVNLTNNISQIYAKEYQINLSNTNAQNLKGSDKYGDIVSSVKTENENTSVNVKFSNPVIGKDQTNQFFLNYNVPDFAKKKGNTWEIQFPTFNNLSENQQVSINLIIPNSFGELSFSSIPIKNTHVINNNTQIQFDQNQLKNKILLIFGNHQLFDFNLKYYVQNKESSEIITKIPLPPDTNGQTIIFKSINPKPNNVLADSDGNWLAEYKLTPSQSLEIVVIGQAKIHPPVAIDKSPSIVGLTNQQKFWPTTDPKITSIIQSVRTPKQIHQYVVSTLSYDYSQFNSAQRRGALYALENPNNTLCTEFTDLFVTLARAADIPAREIEGFAYSNNSKIKPTNPNSDILHAWPEYFDSTKNTWVQIDPTWEKTTNGIDYFSDLDLNHLAFVIHGADSSNPPPPGSYKKDKSTKSVLVDFATESLISLFTPPTLNISGTKLVIFNPNYFRILPFSLSLKNSKWTKQISSMVPLSTIEIDLPQIPFWKQALPSSEKYNFTIDSQNSTSTIYSSLSNPLHYLYLSLCLGIIIIILCLGGIILTANHKKHEKSS